VLALLFIVAAVLLIGSLAESPSGSASNGPSREAGFPPQSRIAAGDGGTAPQPRTPGNTTGNTPESSPAAAGRASGGWSLTFIPTNPASLEGSPDYLAPGGSSWPARQMRSLHNKANVNLGASAELTIARWGRPNYRPPPGDRTPADRQALLEHIAAQNERSKFQLENVEIVSAEPLYFWRATGSDVAILQDLQVGLAGSIEEAQQALRDEVARIRVPKEMEVVYDMRRIGTRFTTHVDYVYGSRQRSEIVYQVFNYSLSVKEGPDVGTFVMFDKLSILGTVPRELEPPRGR
jgi:hypothetical protein